MAPLPLPFETRLPSTKKQPVGGVSAVTPTCESERQHVIILVRKQGLYQLDQNNMS